MKGEVEKKVTLRLTLDMTDVYQMQAVLNTYRDEVLIKLPTGRISEAQDLFLRELQSNIDTAIRTDQ